MKEEDEEIKTRLRKSVRKGERKNQEEGEDKFKIGQDSIFTQ